MDDYAFVMARVRALRRRLRPAAVLVRLALAPGRPPVRELLDLPADSTAAAVEDRLRAEWGEAVARLRGFTSGLARAHFEAFLVTREADNLKAILRGIRAGASWTEIHGATLPAGDLEEAALAELARQPDAEAVARMLASWRSPWAAPLRLALPGHREAENPAEVERALDRHALQRVTALAGEDRAEGAEFLRAWAGLLADRANLRTALARLAAGAAPGPPERDFLTGGGRIGPEAFGRLAAARSFGELADVLTAGRWKEAGEALRGGAAGLSPATRFERALDRIVLRRVRALARRDPVGPAGLALYLLEWQHDVGNLRVLLRAGDYGMDPEDRLGLLVGADAEARDASGSPPAA